MPYPMEDQEMDLWCWAAVALSVEKFLDPGSTLRQCDIARHVRNRRCCPVPVAACDRASSLRTALIVVNHFASRSGQVRFSAIRAELDAYRPVCVRVAWNGGPSAHFLVISGYFINDEGNPVLELSDSAHGPSTAEFSDFRRAYLTTGQWTHTYRVI